MEQPFREGQTVVTSEDRRIGHVVDMRDECLLVETGHVFKSTHAIPASFVHANGDELRATVSKEIVESSPAVDADAWDCEAVLVHYGLAGPFEVDPDPDGLENAETVGARAGVEPAPHERIRTLDETERPGYDKPAVRERSATANDPTGVTANRRANP
jgi:hypothetical protein